MNSWKNYECFDSVNVRLYYYDSTYEVMKKSEAERIFRLQKENYPNMRIEKIEL